MPPTFSAGSASVNIVPDFAGAQRRIGEWFAGMRDVKMNVEPNLDRTAMTKVNAQVAMHKPKLHIDVDHLHLSRQVGEAIESMTGVTEVAGKLSAIINPTIFAGAIAGLGQMAAAATQAGGALGMIPAAIVGVAAPIAAVTIGLQGMGDAFKAFAKGDAEEVRKALANLSPAARQFATEIHALGPAWKAARLDIQQQLFVGLNGSIQQLARTWIPLLRSGLSTVAGEVGRMGAAISGVLSTRQSVNDYSLIFVNVSKMLHELTPGVAALTAAFRDMAAVGSERLAALGGLFSDGAKKAAAWVAEARRTGELDAIFTRAFSIIGEVTQLVVQLARVFVNLFRPAMESGTQLIHVVAGILREVANFLALDTSQASLKFFFESVTGAVSHMQPAILALTDAIVNVLIPGFGELLHVLAPIVDHFFVELAHLLHVLHPLFPGLATAIGALITATEPLIGILANIISDILPVFIRLMNVAAPVIGELTTEMGLFAHAGLEIVVPLLNQLTDVFGSSLRAGMDLLKPLGDLVLALLPSLVSILSAAIPLVQALLQIFGPLATKIMVAVTPALASVANTISKLLTPVLKFLTDNIWIVIGAMATWGAAMAVGAVAAAGGLVSAINTMIVRMAIWVGSLNVVKGATILWTAAQWLLNAALTANPIGLVIVGLVALGAALVVAWNKSETFRTVVTNGWKIVSGYIKFAWESVIKPAWNAMVAAALFMWNNVLKPTWAAIQAGWNALVSGIRALWQNVLKPVWDVLVTVAKIMLTTLKVLVFGPILLAWLGLTKGVEAAWNNILKPCWNAIQTAARFMYQNVLLPVWNAMKTAWTATLNAFKWAWDNILRPMWAALQRAAEILWRNVLSPIWSGMKSAWDGLMRGMRIVYDRVISPMWGIIKSAVGSVKSAFDTAVSGMRTAWDRIKAIAAAPINFVVRTVLRDGLFKAWNWLLDQLGIKSWKINTNASWLQGIRGYATGGKIVGPWMGPRADNVLIKANPGEFMVQEPVARRATPFLSALNEGEKDALDLAANYQGYASGGLIALGHRLQAMGAKVTEHPAFGGVTQGAHVNGSQHYLGNAIDVNTRPGTSVLEQHELAPMAALARQLGFHVIFMAPGHFNHMHVDGQGSGAAIPGGAGGGQTWWGKLWNSVTGAFGWLKKSIGAVGQMGSKFGNSPLVGWVKEMPGNIAGAMFDKVKGSIARMMADAAAGAMAMNAAAAGGAEQVSGTTQQAVRFVANTYGWGSGAEWNSLYKLIQGESGWNMHAANPSSSARGLFQKMTSIHGPIEPTATGQAKWGLNYIKKSYGDPINAYSKWSSRHPHWYDNGGYIPPGLTTIFNGTGRPEPVLTASEKDGLDRWRHRGAKADGGSTGISSVHVYLGNEEITHLVDARIEYRNVRDGINARSR